MNNCMVMVQLANPEWTREAMHLACAIAHRNQTAVVLVRFLPVPSMGLVGQYMADTKLSHQDRETIHACSVIAGEYSVQLHKVDFEYYALLDALIDAALHVNAVVVFAAIPPRLISFWHMFELWNLRRKLNRAGCTLYTLGSSDDNDSRPRYIVVRKSRSKLV